MICGKIGWAYTRSEVARRGFSEVNYCPDVSLDTRGECRKGSQMEGGVTVTKMGTPEEEKLNLGFTAGFRIQVCKQCSAISVAHMQQVSQQKSVVGLIPVTDIPPLNQLFLN